MSKDSFSEPPRSRARSRPPTPLPLLPALGLLLAACAGDPAGDAPPGVDRVHEIATEEIELVGVSELLSRVRDVEIGPDGTVWALNDAPPYFLGFDGEGALAASFGGQGEGPNEFRTPRALVRAEGSLWAFDRFALVRIAAPAELPEFERVSIPRDSFPGGWLIPFDEMRLSPELSPAVVRVGIVPAEAGFLLARAGEASGASSGLTGRSIAPPSALWDAEVLFISTDGEVRPYLAIRELLERDRTAEAPYGGARVLLPFPLLAACRDGSGALYDPERNHLRTDIGGGGATGVIPLPPRNRFPLEEDALYRILIAGVLAEAPLDLEESELREAFGEMFEQIREEAFAEVFPEYTALRCEEPGVFWLQRFDPGSEREGRGDAWLRIETAGDAAGEASGEGAWLEEVRFPERFIPMRFEEGAAWGIVLDEWDVPSVARVEIG